jgi:enoyl-CoA hydratase/carnithine racemase
VHKHAGTSRFPTLFRLIGELGKPTICAANGHVLAGALGLALACDLIVAKDSVRFGTPEINVGRLPVHDHGADLPQRPAQEDD